MPNSIMCTRYRIHTNQLYFEGKNVLRQKISYEQGFGI